MTQNRSQAVMSQRRLGKDELEDFPTPKWATRALCEHVIDIRGCRVWEPACGRGHMSSALREYAVDVLATDIHDYCGTELHDFLGPLPSPLPEIEWAITNPAFKRAQEFVERGLFVADRGVAVLVRSVFTEGGKRYRDLFSKRPPSLVAQFVERVPIVKGRVDKTATTATSYCWMVWWRVPIWPVTKLIWIPPCRKRLERDEDYA